MSEQTIQVNEPPRWTRLLAAGLFGWLVFIFSAFLVIIGLSVLFNAAGVKILLGSSLFILLIVITILVSTALYYYFARKTYVWFSRMRPALLYIILATLLCITVISFPTPFMFTAITSW